MSPKVMQSETLEPLSLRLPSRGAAAARRNSALTYRRLIRAANLLPPATHDHEKHQRGQFPASFLASVKLLGALSATDDSPRVRSKRKGLSDMIAAPCWIHSGTQLYQALCHGLQGVNPVLLSCDRSTRTSAIKHLMSSSSKGQDERATIELKGSAQELVHKTPWHDL